MTVALKITASLNRPSYLVGDQMVLTVGENVPGVTIKLDYKVSDSLNHVWIQLSKDASGAVFTATAVNTGSVAVTAKVTRVFDQATDSVTVNADVAKPVVTSKVLMGVSMSDEDHGLKQWDAAHCYNKGDVDTAHGYGAKAVCFSDSARWTVTGTVDAAAVKNDLQAIRSKYPDLVIRYSWGNEVDRHVSTAQTPKYLSNLKAIRTVVDGLGDDGITLWTSFTKGIFQGGSWISSTPADWKPIAPVLDGIAVNLYPPGRDDSPPKPDQYPTFIDKSLETVAAWGVELFACWEVGFPIFDNPGSAAPYRNRPEYMKGLRDYILKKCDDLGLTATELCYWDQFMSSKGKFDNRLFLDAPKTANAWVTF